jgi:hypothetical protein
MNRNELAKELNVSPVMWMTGFVGLSCPENPHGVGIRNQPVKTWLEAKIAIKRINLGLSARNPF